MFVKLYQIFDRYFYPTVVAALLFVSTSVMATGHLEAKVDRNQVAKGETLQLSITLQDKDWENAPNFEPLEKDFSILGVAHQQRVNIINGQSTTATEWRVTLSPKKNGGLGHSKFYGFWANEYATLNRGDSRCTTFKSTRNARYFFHDAD